MSIQNLSQAYQICGSATGLLYKLFGNGVDLGTGQVYTAQEFTSDWGRGGKAYLEGKWRDSANVATGHVYPTADSEGNICYDDDNREMYRGKHEWVPTNMLSYVLEHCINHNKPQWLMLAETLRSATRNVIFKPSIVSYSRGQTNPFGLSGHVGAVYVTYGGRPHRKFKGQGPFHDALRTILRAHLNANNSDIQGFCVKIVEFINAYCWLGDPNELAMFLGTDVNGLRQTACPYSYLSGVNQHTSWGNSLFDMATSLQNNWTNNEWPSLENICRAAVFANSTVSTTPSAPFTPEFGEELHPSAYF